MSGESDNKLVVFRNSDVKKIVAFIPRGHKHIRLYIEFDEMKIILQEATVAAIVRAYVNIKNHPTRRAYELVSQRLMERKEGYAEYQLIESTRDEEEILLDMENIID